MSVCGNLLKRSYCLYAPCSGLESIKLFFSYPLYLSGFYESQKLLILLRLFTGKRFHHSGRSGNLLTIRWSLLCGSRIIQLHVLISYPIRIMGRKPFVINITYVRGNLFGSYLLYLFPEPCGNDPDLYIRKKRIVEAIRRNSIIFFLIKK